MGPPESHTGAAKIKRRIGGSDGRVARDGAGVSSKDASSRFIRDTPASAIAVKAAAMQRGAGRGGKRSSDTAARAAAKRNETGKAVVTGSESKAGKARGRSSRASARG
jgi:hypothetical protein